jgi:DNA replication protein DnaC
MPNSALNVIEPEPFVPVPPIVRPLFDWGDKSWWHRALRPRLLLLGTGVFTEHLSARLTDFSETVASDAISDRAQTVGLLVKGAPGRGKTRLAAALVRYYVLDGWTARFAMAGDVLSEIRETFRDDSPRSEREVVEDLCAVRLLVLDDLGREGGGSKGQSSAYTLAVLHRILTKRIGAGHTTVITTNLGLPELEAYYDGAIASRLHALEHVTLGGKDWRKT